MGKMMVVKIGSNVLADKTGELDVKSVDRVKDYLRGLQKQGYRVVVVVSGAVQFGRKKFTSKNAAAAWGQVKLTKAFGDVGQILLCKRDLQNVTTRRNLLKIVGDFWRQDLVVLINENDVVELNSFGGNDFLALEMARLVGAQEIVLLSNVAGFLDKDKRVIKEVHQVNSNVWRLVNDKQAQGVGGMKAKLLVARECIKEGRKMTITNGTAGGTVFV